jgi:hypothetical protein
MGMQEDLAEVARLGTRRHNSDKDAADHYRSCYAFMGAYHAKLQRNAEDAKSLRRAIVKVVEHDETIDGEHVGTIPFPHSAVGRKYKLVRIDAMLSANGMESV